MSTVAPPALGSSRRWALGAAVVLGLALAVVIAVVTPWHLQPTPAGGSTPVDPSAAFTPAQTARAEAFAGALRPASLVSLVLSLAVSAVLGLTRAGAAVARAVARPLGGGWVGRVLLARVGRLGFAGPAPPPLSPSAEVVRPG